MGDLPPAQLIFIAVAGGASLATWIWIAVRRAGQAEWLPYESRRSVPWDGGLGMLAVFLLLMTILASSAPQQPIDMGEQRAVTSEKYVEAVWAEVLFKFALVGVASLWIVKGLAGSTRDLGLPQSSRQWRRDVLLGLFTALAALAPTYIVQILAVQLLDWSAYHPTLEQIFKQPDWQVIVASVAAAVIAAPIAEEFLFRLLLQGWLEKVEDALLGWKTTSQNAQEKTAQPGESTPDESVADATRESLMLLPGLPHGWAPILASAMLFGIAHLGLGPSPIPLFFFGIILGYVYQRTHRIMPCIVAHMAFNALSLTIACVWGPQ